MCVCVYIYRTSKRNKKKFPRERENKIDKREAENESLSSSKDSIKKSMADKEADKNPPAEREKEGSFLDYARVQKAHTETTGKGFNTERK